MKQRLLGYGWLLFVLCGFNFVLTATEKDPFLQKSSFEVLIPKESIDAQMKKIAHEIDVDCQGKPLTIVMLMKGAFIVTADLIRHLQTPCTVEFIQTSSYGSKGKVRGELTIHGLEKIELTGKDILVVDDVFDSGVTLSTVVNKLKTLSPRSVRSLVLLSKNIPRPVSYEPDYVLFDIDDRFVVGYGMDYKEYWRELPDIMAVPL